MSNMGSSSRRRVHLEIHHFPLPTGDQLRSRDWAFSRNYVGMFKVTHSPNELHALVRIWKATKVDSWDLVQCQKVMLTEGLRKWQLFMRNDELLVLHRAVIQKATLASPRDFRTIDAPGWVTCAPVFSHSRISWCILTDRNTVEFLDEKLRCLRSIATPISLSQDDAVCASLFCNEAKPDILDVFLFAVPRVEFKKTLWHLRLAHSWAEEEAPVLWNGPRSFDSLILLGRSRLKYLVVPTPVFRFFVWERDLEFREISPNLNFPGMCCFANNLFTVNQSAHSFLCTLDGGSFDVGCIPLGDLIDDWKDPETVWYSYSGELYRFSVRRSEQTLKSLAASSLVDQLFSLLPEDEEIRTLVASSSAKYLRENFAKTVYPHSNV